MKQLLAALLALFLIDGVAVSGFQGSSEWIKYDSSEGRYSVLLPARPKLTTQEASAASGEKFLQYIASASDANAVFLTGYFDHISGATFSLDKARDGMVLSVKGTLINEASIALAGNPGREFEVSATGADGVEYLVRARFYDVDQRVYLLQFIIAKADDDKAAGEKAAKYFESFKVIKAP